MDMGLSCWSQSCSLSLKPWPVQWLGGFCLQSAAGKSQIKSQQGRRSFLHCCVSSSLRHPADHNLVPISAWSEPAGRKHRQTRCPATTPPLQAEQGTKDLSSSFSFRQTLISTAKASTGTKAPALNRKEQAGEKIKHREWDCTLPSSLNELRCSTGGWLHCLILASFQFKSHNFIKKLFQDGKLCVSMKQTPATKCCVTTSVVAEVQKDKVLCKLCIAKVIHSTLVIMVHYGMNLHYVNISNFFPSLQHKDLLNYFTGH